MAIQRNWTTPLAAGAFLLSAVTGVLIFFHADSGANKVVHEWLSWALLAGVTLHAITNFGALKVHLKRRQSQLIIGVFALLLAISFLPLGDDGGPPFKRPVAALSAAPLTTLADVARISPNELTARLAQAGFRPSAEHQTLNDVVGQDLGRQMRALNAVLGGRR